jgi:hypothetical protein
VGPVPDPLLLRKSGSAGNRTRDLWICSQELTIRLSEGTQIEDVLSTRENRNSFSDVSYSYIEFLGGK